MSSPIARRVTIFDNENAALWYHPYPRIIHHEIRRFVHGEQFRQILDKGLEVFVARGAHKWLSDDRGNGPLSPADGKWAETDWGPRVIAAGWEYWAIVLPEKILGQMNMRIWIDLYLKKGVTVQAFSDPEEAMTWLEQQPTVPTV
jgi:hypothetical protein